MTEINNRGDTGDPSKASPHAGVSPAPPTGKEAGKPTGWRRWLYRLLTATIVPAFFLLGLELLLRLCGYGYPSSFFVAREAGVQSVWAENVDFSRRFFPPGPVPIPEPLVFAAAKSAATYRIFILGESAAMGFPDAAAGFGRILAIMLRERYPQGRFQIVNTGMVAINSHVIVPIAQDCTEHEPDLFIAYIGNNEVAGPFGACGVLGPFTPNLQLVRAGTWVRANRTGQLLSNGVRHVVGGKLERAGWRGMKTYIEHQVAAGDSRLPAVYANFASNLRDICDIGRHAGARVLLCTVASNLKDSPPFASLHSPTLLPEQLESWQQKHDDGVRLESAHDYMGAIQCYRQALEIDAQHAGLHFRLARCLAALGQNDEARSRYLLAREWDALRFRADMSINKAIRAVAQGQENEGIFLVDVEQAFANASPPTGCPGEELFHEHVHLSFAGNYLLARILFEQIVPMLPDTLRPRPEARTEPLSAQDCMKRLPFTDWNQRFAMQQIADVVGNPPFTNQLDHGARKQRFIMQLKELQAKVRAGGLEQAAAAYRLASGYGADACLHKDFASLLWEQRDLEGAMAQLRLALQEMPHDHLAQYRLAVMFMEQKRPNHALTACAESIRLMPDSAQSQNLMGVILTQLDKPAAAVAPFRRALKLNPDAADIHFNFAETLARENKLAEAIAQLREALRIQPEWSAAQEKLQRLTLAQQQRKN